jgi:hypothetical protein
MQPTAAGIVGACWAIFMRRLIRLWDRRFQSFVSTDTKWSPPRGFTARGGRPVRVSLSGSGLSTGPPARPRARGTAGARGRPGTGSPGRGPPSSPARGSIPPTGPGGPRRRGLAGQRAGARERGRPRCPAGRPVGARVSRSDRCRPRASRRRAAGIDGLRSSARGEAARRSAPHARRADRRLPPPRDPRRRREVPRQLGSGRAGAGPPPLEPPSPVAAAGDQGRRAWTVTGGRPACDRGPA